MELLHLILAREFYLTAPFRILDSFTVSIIQKARPSQQFLTTFMDIDEYFVNICNVTRYAITVISQ